MQKYPHMIELFACILNKIAFMLFPNNNFFLIMCSTPKLPKEIISLFKTCKAINDFQHLRQELFHIPHSLLFGANYL